MYSIMILRVYVIICSLVIFSFADCQAMSCSKSIGSSCPTGKPLFSGAICPDGFDLVENQCFRVSEDKQFWNESKSKCEELDTKLAEPKELFNSTEFNKYLYQHTYERNVSGWRDRLFALGGIFTNYSWKWLTGGNVSYNSYYATGMECLALFMYQDSRIFNELNSYFVRVPCNISAILENDYRITTLRYICQTAPKTIEYSPCEYNGTQFPSGEVVSSLPNDCEQLWCEDGIIDTYSCGNMSKNCCVYKGKMYGAGDVIEPGAPTNDCMGCQQLVCKENLLGGSLEWQECTNCSIKCCLFNGMSYKPGDYIKNGCARLVCEGATGEFRNLGIYSECPKCSTYLDPHIVTYDQRKSYSYQGCGNYSLTQVGNTYNPDVAVYATFQPCGGSSSLTCVDSITFKNDENTVINIHFDVQEWEIKILVNGEHIDVEQVYSPRVVEAMGTTYPVWTWKSYNCVNLQGSSGILVRFCGSNWANQVYIWAHPEVAGELKGLCGTVNDDVDDDFQTREGAITSPWQRNPHQNFPLSWLATAEGNRNCSKKDVDTGRSTKSESFNTFSRLIIIPLNHTDFVQNKCDSNVDVLKRTIASCQDAVTCSPNVNLQEVQTLIDDCVFDMCNVSSASAWLSAVRETCRVQEEIKEKTQNFSKKTTTIASTTIELKTTTPTTAIQTTAVDPSTTVPNITIDCTCNKACWKKSGYCTNKPETCNGRIKKCGCLGTNCVCCIPPGCRPKKRCQKKGGVCISSEKSCDGRTIKGCKGRKGCKGKDCVCCLKKDRCKPKKVCLKDGGKCIRDPQNCNGYILENGCKTDNCFCCMNQPRC